MSMHHATYEAMVSQSTVGQSSLAHLLHVVVVVYPPFNWSGYGIIARAQMDSSGLPAILYLHSVGSVDTNVRICHC